MGSRCCRRVADCTARHATRRDNAWVWVSYGIVLTASILLDIYLALMLLAHIAFLWFYRHSRPVLVRSPLHQFLRVVL